MVSFLFFCFIIACTWLLVSVLTGVVVFQNFGSASSFTILRHGRSSYGKVFPFSTTEKLKRGSFFSRTLKPKSTQYKDKWTVDVFRNWQAAREKKFPLLDSGIILNCNVNVNIILHQLMSGVRKQGSL